MEPPVKKAAVRKAMSASSSKLPRRGDETELAATIIAQGIAFDGIMAQIDAELERIDSITGRTAAGAS
jgi:hypothetical protein